jgi:hypothetical protein
MWLVVSGSPDVSNSFVTPYSKSFVSHKNIVNYSVLAFGKRQKNSTNPPKSAQNGHPKSVL